MKTVTAMLCFALIVGCGACRTAEEQPDGGTPVGGVEPPGRQMVTGTVNYVDLEGGFYGIVTDEGERFNPVNLPDDFKEDGLEVRAYIERMQDRVSFHMWGTLVRVHDIERL